MSAFYTSNEPIDAIEGMARKIANYCTVALDNVDRIQCIMDQSETAGQALDLMVQSAILPSGDYEHLKTIRDDIPRLQVCIERMDDIKCLARNVFRVNYSGTAMHGAEYVFNQEVCFSYASKMLVSVGPLLQHFENDPTKDKVIGAELAIAMKTPIYVDDDQEPRRERKTTLSMPTSVREAARIVVRGGGGDAVPKQQRVRSRIPATVGDLICNEDMAPSSAHKPAAAPLPMQTRQSRRPQPTQSCQRSILCKGQASTLLPPLPK